MQGGHNDKKKQQKDERVNSKTKTVVFAHIQQVSGEREVEKVETHEKRKQVFRLVEGIPPP